MAACRAGENTTFPFLATVRSLVAIVVSVLAVAVVVMVIVFVHRPVEMDLQSYGYVQTQEWWWIYNNTTRVYEPAKEVPMLIIIHALNPSGRGQIQGNINIVRIMDIPNASFVEMVDFSRFEPTNASFEPTNVSFDLQPHSSHRYRRWVSLKDPASLYYLYDRHHQDASLGFPVMVVVETTYKPAHSEKSINKTYYCWPVTFLCSDSSTPDGGEVPCKTEEDLEYKVSWRSPPPAPSPPPAVAGNWTKLEHNRMRLRTSDGP
ncbi:hypothetical protein SEVIR_8G247020v4 [Setaria viridis]|uniref:Uncharacterized protein n=1 Tax=Setaria viridis TaxID=4556 RepID=A0A4U6TND6_SETVI|nr:uncharacterized protein LOC117866342 [Setaria viridis]TKW02513.1 hypothetical protein SEVIR_8G247020v2 [Setaria viridis]